jgi:hypothetical protein
MYENEILIPAINHWESLLCHKPFIDNTMLTKASKTVLHTSGLSSRATSC